MTNPRPNKILYQSGGLASPTGALPTPSFPKSCEGSDSLIDGSWDTQQGIAPRRYYDYTNNTVSSESYIFLYSFVYLDKKKVSLGTFSYKSRDYTPDVL